MASAVASADAAAGKYSVMSAILGFLGHVWTPLPSLHPPPTNKAYQKLRKFQQLWTLPTDGIAKSVIILLPCLNRWILDMDGTENILVLFFRR